MARLSRSAGPTRISLTQLGHYAAARRLRTRAAFAFPSLRRGKENWDWCHNGPDRRLLDLLPTFCEIGQVESPKNIDGISILPTLLGQGKQSEHPYLYWEFPAYTQPQAVRAGDWKIVRNGVDGGDPPFELYNLKDDIGEKYNVANEHPDVVDRLKKYAGEAHTPSDIFPLLAGERPKGYKPAKAKSTE